mmetsp:Transcript_33691/g.100239  ORF Transcript_33691/g.100239 Transcript_33691/m.100239 type:complete len:238 (-) Transcript_33691:875-1588(-)
MRGEEEEKDKAVEDRDREREHESNKNDLVHQLDAKAKGKVRIDGPELVHLGLRLCAAREHVSVEQVGHRPHEVDEEVDGGRVADERDDDELTARDVPARAEAAHRVVERELVRVCVEKEVEEGGDDDGEDLEDGHLDHHLLFALAVRVLHLDELREEEHEDEEDEVPTNVDHQRTKHLREKLPCGERVRRVWVDPGREVVIGDEDGEDADRRQDAHDARREALPLPLLPPRVLQVLP